MSRNLTMTLTIGICVWLSLFGLLALAQHHYDPHHYPAHTYRTHRYPTHRFGAHKYRQHQYGHSVAAGNSRGASASQPTAPPAGGLTGGVPEFGATGLPAGLENLLPSLPGFSGGPAPGAPALPGAGSSGSLLPSAPPNR